MVNKYWKMCEPASFMFWTSQFFWNIRGSFTIKVSYMAFSIKIIKAKWFILSCSPKIYSYFRFKIDFVVVGCRCIFFYRLESAAALLSLLGVKARINVLGFIIVLLTAGISCFCCCLGPQLVLSPSLIFFWLTVVMGLRSRSVGGPKSQTEKTEDLLTARHLRCHEQAGADQQQSADSEYHSFASLPPDYEFRF